MSKLLQQKHLILLLFATVIAFTVCMAEEDVSIDIDVPYIVNDGLPEASLFAHPYSVIANDSGDILVADTQNNRIVKLVGGYTDDIVVFPTHDDLVNLYESEDQLQTIKTNDGTQDEQVVAYMLSSEQKRLLKPQGIAAYQNLVFVADSGSGRIVVLEDKGDHFEFIRDYGSFMDYGFVRDIAVDSQGSFYIADGEGGRVFKFSKDGVPWSFGANKPAIEGFLSPYGLTVDTQGNIYVADTSNHRVLKYNPSGELLLTFGERGKAPGHLFFPHDVTIDNEGSVYIADCENYRIQKFDSEGNFLGTIGDWGKEKGEFFHLRKIAFTQRDGKNLVLAVDSTLMRVQGIEIDPFIKIEHEPIKLINSNPFLISANITTRLEEPITATIEYRINDGVENIRALPVYSGTNYRKNLTVSGLQTNHVLTYRIVATSQSGIRNFTEYYRAQVDLTPPTITSYSPANNHLFGTEDIVISANYYDIGLGIDTAGIVLKIDNAQVTPQTVGESSLEYTFTSGAGASDGTHSVSLEVADIGGLVTLQPWSYIVDRTPPQATLSRFTLIDYPDTVRNNASGYAILTGRVNVIGTITDAHLESYTISYAAGASPANSAFTEIKTLTTATNINNGSLYYWDTSNITDGTYTLRVIARDRAGNISSPAKLVVELDNTAPKGAIISPYFSQVITDLTAPGGNIEVRAKVRDKNLTAYSVDYFDTDTCGGSPWINLDGESGLPLVSANPIEVNTLWKVPDVEPGVTRTYALRFYAKDAYQASEYCNVFNIGLEGIVITPKPTQNMATNKVMYDLSDSGRITVQVYRVYNESAISSQASFAVSSAAQLVKNVIVNEDQPRGLNEAYWDGTNNSGVEVSDSSSSVIYYYLISAENDALVLTYAFGRVTKNQLPKILSLSVSAVNYDIAFQMNKLISSADVQILNGKNAEVKAFTLANASRGSNYVYTIDWNGSNRYGQTIESDAYTVYVKVKDSIGNETEKESQFTAGQSKPVLTATSPTYKRTDPVSHYLGTSWGSGSSIQIGNERSVTSTDDSDVRSKLGFNNAAYIKAIHAAQVYEVSKNTGLSKTFEWNGRTINPANQAVKINHSAAQYQFTGMNSLKQFIGTEKRSLFSDSTPPGYVISQGSGSDLTATIQTSEQNEYLKNYILSVYDGDQNFMGRAQVTGNEDIWSGTTAAPVRSWKEQFKNAQWTTAGTGVSLITNSYLFEIQGEDVAGNVSSKSFDVKHDIPYSSVDNGAIIISDDGKSELRIPPGSVPSPYAYDDFDVTTRTPGNVISQTSQPPSGMYFLDRAYDFVPSGVQFDEDNPPILRMYYDYTYVNGQVRVLVNGEPISGGPEVLAFYFYDEDTMSWERIGAAPSVENLGKSNERRYLSAPLYHLSNYALLIPTDFTAPVASITSPSPLLETGENFVVRGTASDANIKEYILKFGFGENPASWSILKKGTASVSNNVLGYWDARTLSGEYTLSLTVWDRSGNVSTDRRNYLFAMPGGDVVPGGNDMDTTPPSITGITTNSSVISPAGNGPVSSVVCNYTISENSYVNISVVDSSGGVVKVLQTEVFKLKGQNSISWNGTAEAGGYASDVTVRFSIEAVDSNTNSSTAQSSAIVVDSVSPTFSEFVPDDGSVSPVLRPEISVKVADNYSGINEETFEVTLNGQSVYNFTYLNGVLLFTPLVEITGGINTVYVAVEDNVGNSSMATWAFTGDVTPPLIVSFEDNPDPFSPSESIGIKDDIYFNSEIIEPYGFVWSITIKDSNSVAIKTLSGQEAAQYNENPISVQTKWNGYFNSLNEFDEYDLAFAEEGVYTYLFVVTDTAGNVSQQSGSFEIDDTNPALSAVLKDEDYISPDNSAGAQDTVTISSSISEKNPEKWEAAFFNSENHMVFSYQETITQQNITDYPISYTWNGMGDGVHRPELPVPDDEYSFTLGGYDNAGNFAFETGTFILDNTNPVPVAGSDFSVFEGSTANFDATSSTDNLSGIRAYAWDLDENGDYEIHTATTSTIYPDDALINVWLLVEDNAANTDTDSVEVTVLNVAPVVDAGAENREIQYSDTINFSADHTDPGVLDTHVYDWDFGDNTVHATGPYPGMKDTSHRYLVPSGLYVLNLTVTDDDGGVGTDRIYVKVLKEDTTIEYSGELSKQYSDVVSLSATLSEIDDEIGDLSNKLVTWTIGNQKVSARTDADGYAEAVLQINQVPGTYTVETNFAGDDYYLPSHDSDEFIIHKENLIMTFEDVVADYWGTEQGDRGDVVTSRMTIVDEDDSVLLPLAGEPLELQLDYDPVILGATPIETDPPAESFGAAPLVFNVPFESEGVYTTELSFFGNDWFNPASTTATLTIQDSHPPKVELTYPSGNNCGICRLMNGTVKLIGSANDIYADDELLPVYPPSPDDFLSYRIDYAPGWDAVLLSAQAAEVTVDQNRFVLSSGSLSPGDTVIFGTGAGENAVYDVLTYTVTSVLLNEIEVSPDIQQPTVDAVGTSPDVYRDLGIWTMIHESSDAVSDDVLGEWDTTTVPEGNYTLKVTVSEVERSDGVTKPNVSISFANVSVIGPETDVLSKAVYGSLGHRMEDFNHPAYVAVDHAGNMYVTDRNHDRVQKITPEGEFTVLVDEGLNKPEGIAIDMDGNIYFADSNNDRIMKIDADGVLSEFKTGFNKPKGVVVTLEGYIYIADRNNDLVYVFDKWGDVKLTIPMQIHGAFDKPQALAVDAAGNIYVTDRNNDNVVKFDMDGNRLLEFGDSGQGILNKPEGIVVNERGYIYVADTNTDRIVKYDPYGNFVMQLGVSGHGVGQFNKPGGLALFGCDEKLYVADQNNARIQVYGAEGLFENQPVVISNLFNYPDPLDPVRGTTIYFNLSKSVPVEVKVYNDSGIMVRDLTSDIIVEEHAFKVDWNATDDNGDLVPGGEFTVIVSAADGTFTITEEIVVLVVN